jgi:hypothetical protein
MDNEEGCEHENCEDISLHKCKCNDCGEIFYYSKAAKDYYVNGDLSATDILFTK